ncbi:Barstar [Azospirillaceae bacterium]
MNVGACVLNGAEIASSREFYQTLKTQLGAPEWTGNNCDALWDLLTGLIEGPKLIVWLHSEHSKKNLGPDFEKLLSVLKDAAKEGYIQLQVQ